MNRTRLVPISFAERLQSPVLADFGIVALVKYLSLNLDLY